MRHDEILIRRAKRFALSTEGDLASNFDVPDQYSDVGRGAQ